MSRYAHCFMSPVATSILIEYEMISCRCLADNKYRKSFIGIQATNPEVVI